MSYKRLKQSYGPFTRILGLDSNYLGLGDVGDGEHDENDLKRKLPTVVTLDSTTPNGGLSSSGGGIVTLPTTVSDAMTAITTNTNSSSSDQVKLRMSAALKKRIPSPLSPMSQQNISNNNSLMVPRHQGGSTPIAGSSGNNKLSPVWTDMSSNCYSDAELLEDMLSDSSVNDLLSGVGGDGCVVYQDLENSISSTNAGLNTAISNTLSLLNSPGQLDSLLAGSSEPLPSSTVGELMPHSSAAPDALYGDASYASCYSNLEFVMNRARNAQHQQPQSTSSPPGGGGDSLIRGALFPAVPSKNASEQDDDAGIYGVPSNRPVHATKAALLQYRGFATTHQLPQPGDSNKNIVTEMDLDQDDDLLPKTVLDLFV